MAEPDPFEVLSLAPDASRAEVEAARRHLARSLHPDRGGDASAMQRVNRAADLALEAIAQREADSTADRARSGPDASSVPRRRGTTNSGPGRFGSRRDAVTHDHPSFVIEALPAVAHAALVVVASQLGHVTEDDPPYLLEAVIANDRTAPVWCRLELLPEAGSSSVGLSIAPMGRRGPGPVEIDEVRDRWISGLNELDWSDL